jgi:hypothetical protein
MPRFSRALSSVSGNSVASGGILRLMLNADDSAVGFTVDFDNEFCLGQT